MQQLKEKKIKNKGQAAMEYIIISALIGITCMSIVSNYGSVMKKHFTKMKERLNEIQIK